MQATITVAGISPPGQGKKQGHVIDTQGDKWNVWGDKLHNYQMGVTYEITYDPSEFNGAKFNVVKTAKPLAATSGGGGGGGIPYTTSAPRRVEVPQSLPQPTAKDEMIFVCGVVNNAMSNTNINPFEITLTELIAMVDKARSAWRNTLGKSQKANDMDDEIPF